MKRHYRHPTVSLPSDCTPTGMEWPTSSGSPALKCRFRFLGRFMGRDYVTIREEKHDGTTIMAETSVGRMLLKSAPARVVQRDRRYQIDGMAWGPTPISSVEVRIDNGGWKRAKLEDSRGEYAWRAWSLDWSPAPGEHTVTSRAIDTAGHIQPAMDDPLIADKRTYWESNGQITRNIRIA